MKIETLTYSAGETTFQGYLADPEGSGRRPGVLIVHEAPGLNDHPKRRACGRYVWRRPYRPEAR
jgi:dienelactone hydrolase